MSDRKRTFHRFGTIHLDWRKWELCLGVYLDTWVPREWSVVLCIGPLHIQGGIEEDWQDV